MIQKLIIKSNSVTYLRTILKKYKPKSILLVSGKKSYIKSGAKSKMDPILSKYEVTNFTDFSPNPKLEDVKKGIAIFKKNKCDFVLAVGGGSAIDVAKCINILSSNHYKPEDIITKKQKIEKKGKTFVVIPTTAGSGSESTKFAVVYLGKTKYSIDNDLIVPDYALVDYKLMMSLPKNITASTGMDVFCQAIEAYWCVNSNNESKEYSKKAIKLVLASLANAVNNPDAKSRKNMAIAANLAGRAINITRTTSCHAISYPITSYFRVLHGHAVALTIGSMLKFNIDVTDKDVLDKRGSKYVKNTIKEIIKLLGCKNSKDADKKIQDLMKTLGLSTKLSELGIKFKKNIETIIKNGFNPDRVKNNPRRLTKESLREVLCGIK
jgi:alcohol dehydrogenase